MMFDIPILSLDEMTMIGFKYVYRDELSRINHYKKFGKLTICMILSDHGQWSLSHDYYYPEQELINKKARELLDHEDDTKSNNAEIIRKLIEWIEKCVQEDEDQFDESAFETSDVDMSMSNNVNAKDDIDSSPDRNNYIIKTSVPLNIKHNKIKKLNIYVWGRCLRDKVPDNFKIQHNFNACVLHGKKQGVDWRNDGRNEDIRLAVMRGSGFYDFMSVMVELIESRNLERIGINCAKGRHRSVTCAIILKTYFYPSSDIRFLELR